MNFEGRPVVPTIIKRYLAQRNRGTEGFGFYIPETNRLTHNIREGRILNLLKREKDASEVLLHHRFPTSTANVRNACHPFSTKDNFENNYVVVHNGVVRNPEELHKQHEDAGISYISEQENGRFNDSEALTYDLARYFEGQVDHLTATGSIAFICIKRDKDGKPMTLFFGRNTNSPLKMKKTKHSLTLSSEGEGDIVEANKLYSYSYDTGELVKRDLTIPGGYVYSGSTRPYGGTYVPPIHKNPIDVPSAVTGYDDNDEIEDIEQRWMELSEIKAMKESIQYEANYDDGIALTLGEERMRDLKARNVVLEDLTDNAPEEAETGEDLSNAINEYCDNEDKIKILHAVMTDIRHDIVEDAQNRQHQMKLAREAREEGHAEHRIGFQQTQLLGATTGKHHIVPEYKHSRNNIPRYAD